MKVNLEMSYEEREFLKSDYTQVRGSLTNRPGVYILISKGDIVLYVGMSKDLAGRLRSHVSGYSHVDTSMLHHIKVLLTNTSTEADMLETYKINELKPLFNISKADYPEFIEELDYRLPIVEEKIENIKLRIKEICAEIEYNAQYDEDEDFGNPETLVLGRELFLIRQLRNTQKQLTELKREESLLKRRGATTGTERQKSPVAVRIAATRKARYGDARGWVNRDTAILGGKSQ